MKKTGLFIFYLVLFIFLIYSCFSQDTDYKRGRLKMVSSQIETRGISDKRVLEAMRKVERHRFVPKELERWAYDDNPLPIGEGQTISQPYIVAFMTEVLKLKQKDKVLEIGSGSGYQAAILAEICDSVYTVEIFKTLTERSVSIFKELGYHNIFCKNGDGYQGWPEHAPYNAIIVTCSPTHIPQPLKDQLVEGGKMIIPVGKYPFQNLVLLVKRNGKITQKKVMPVRFVPMISEDGSKY